VRKPRGGLVPPGSGRITSRGSVRRPGAGAERCSARAHLQQLLWAELEAGCDDVEGGRQRARPARQQRGLLEREKERQITRGQRGSGGLSQRQRSSTCWRCRNSGQAPPKLLPCPRPLGASHPSPHLQQQLDGDVCADAHPRRQRACERARAPRWRGQRAWRAPQRDGGARLGQPQLGLQRCGGREERVGAERERLGRLQQQRCEARQRGLADLGAGRGAQCNWWSEGRSSVGTGAGWHDGGAPAPNRPPAPHHTCSIASALARSPAARRPISRGAASIARRASGGPTPSSRHSSAARRSSAPGGRVAR
jgi:hypothetical protein